ncbi:protein-serine O-palmitoleoyltransferase porcupine-like [Actinia tenebrosa]|uniref:Protein-serine O-palmitoleoyltransferase porcupine n=1 Tax=Actinia tenebrosa TaxID=6105 RepID=A0A6P8I9B9_ACTTE|nr:protein-serine O-palmitoleoyltransferase porcupine-like [Actinia tenebrosa]
MEDFDLADLENDFMYEDLSPDLYEYYQQEDLSSRRFGFMHTFNQCFWPTTTQTGEIVGPLLGLCLVVRVISILPVPRWTVHLVSLVTGCITMYVFVNQYVWYPIIMCLVGYPLVFVPKGYRGPLMAALCLAYILTCEIFIASPDSWHKVRGSQMILAMKIISIAFDSDQGLLSKTPNPLEYFGYALSANAVIFGPFMSYENYSQILAGKRLSFSWFFGVLRSFVLCYVCLIYSVCISPYIFAQNDHKWLVAYQTAMSFRFSHYFVSYMSECTSVVSGVGTEVTQDEKKVTKWQFDVARPQHVELPRSLVEVVIHWNVPNHVFLKNYVFKKARSLGRFVAILLTFGCSSLLHGLNFQLTAVLLSIGMYAYIEHVFRSKLASLFSACIMARKCRPDCGHFHKEGQFWVLATNLSFGFLSVFHLAYLGIMFGGDASEQTQGSSMSFTLKKWTELDFASHWVAMATLLLSIIIPKTNA